jgi:hypothetical protein
MTAFRPSLLLLLLAGGLLLGTRSYDAQAQQQDTTSALPDIAPREVEIRGQLEISLPSLRRQPLVGFNPPPRIPSIPVDRSPWVGDYKQESADLPGTPLRRPEPPPALTGANYPPAGGMVSAWGGRYYSRSVRARLGGPIRPATFLQGRIDYDGLDGHTPDPDAPDVQTPADAFDGTVQLQHYGDAWSGSVTGDGFYESYTLFAARPDPLLPAVVSEPVRKGGGGTGRLTVRRLAPETAEVEAAVWYGNARYQTRRFTDPDLDGSLLIRAQQHVGAAASASVPRERIDIWVETRIQDLGLGSDVDAARGGSVAGGLVLDEPQRYRLRIGARYLGAWSDVPGLDADLQRIDRVSPDVQLEVYPAPQVRLFARNRPAVETPTLAALYAETPYLLSQPVTRPSVAWLDAEGGAQVYAGPVKVVARGGYRSVRQYRYVVQAENQDGYREGLFRFRYNDARILHVGADLSLVLPGSVHATLRGTYRDGTFQNLDGPIPFFADFVGEASLSVSFVESRGLLQVTGRYERARPIDRRESATAPPFVDLDVHLSFDVTEHIGVLGHVANVGFGYNEYWPDYPQSPAVLGAGLRVRW